MINRKNIFKIYDIYKASAALFFCIILFAGISNLFSVEVKKIGISRFEDFQKGELKGVGLDNKGRLAIGPGIKSIAGPAGEYYLSVDTASNGDIYVGTGHKAVVYRIKAPPASAAAAPAIEEIFAPEFLDVYALLVKQSGDVYVGTSPDGKIFKISPNAKEKGGKEFFNPEEKYIWDLKEDKEGNIICAVGNNGGVYKIAPDGQAVKIFEPEDTHIISLFVTSGNAILAGSGDRGTLYRIDNRKAKVLYDSSLEEIRGICEDKNGNIYFSASRGITRFETTKSSKETFQPGRKEDKKEDKIDAKSALFCLRTDGTAEMIWKSTTEYIYTAVYDEKNDGVLIGTGNSGRIYRVKKDGSFSIVFESESAQAYKIIGKNGGFTLITNNTPSITRIEETPAAKGTYYSDIYDLRIQSRVGRLYWEAETNAQTDISMFVRTGNTRIPDSTWSQWSAPFTDSENSQVNISDCRYIQVKASLNSKNGIDTPYLSGIKIYYVQSNLSPQVKRIDIRKQGPVSPAVTVPGKSLSTQPPAKNSKTLAVTWQAEDPNYDKLKYDIYIKKYNAVNWILVKDDSTENKMDMDMELYQDGKYVLKVDADDSLSNPPSVMKSSSMVSSPFIIDSTPPVISNFSAVGSHIRFNVQDQTSVISRVLYSFDGKLWHPVFPVDGIDDSKTESYDADVKNTGAKKIIFLKAIDEYDNFSVFQAEL
jgi:hypothetical protein